MKNLLIIVLNLLVWTTSFGQTGNPGLGGALFDPPTIEVGQTTQLTFSISETGLGVIPADGIIIQISMADLYYKSDGVTPPGGTGGALFNWTYDGSSGDVWFGTNPSEIGIIEGGLVTLDVTGIAVSPDFENTTVNIFINDPNLVGTDNTGDNSVTPKLKVTPATTFDCLNLPNGPNVTGAICDDGDPNTTGDVWDANCDCVGTTTDPCFGFGGDSDGDGICADDDCNDNDASVGLAQTVYIDGDADGLGFNPRPFEIIESDDLLVNTGFGFGGNYNRSQGDVSIEISATAGDFNSTDDFLNLKINDVFIKKIFAGAVDCSGDCSEIVTILEADWNAMLPMFGTPIGVDLESVGNCDPNTSTLCSPAVSVKISYIETSETTGCLGANLAATAGDCDDSNANIKVPGDACDDGDPLTENDMIDADCNCAGTPISTSITITDCPDNIIVTVANPGDLSVPVTWTAPTATTTCPTDGLSLILVPGTPGLGGDFPIGVTSVTYGASDGCNNNAGCSFNVIVSDLLVDDCEGTPGGTALPGTACDDNNVLTENDVWDADCNCAGTLISTSITITDCPDNIIVTVANPGDLTVPVTWTTPTATTDCPTDGLSFVLIPGSPASGSDFSIGVTSVTYGGNDDCGNTAGCTFNVIVSDLLADDCEGTPGGTALPGTACDDGNPLTENDVWDADCNCAGTLISTSITITDCPDNIIVTVANPGDLSVPVTWTAPTATTTCPTDGLSFVLIPGSPASGSDFSIGVTSVTYGGNDDCGNTAGCTFNVIVSDLLVDDCEGTPGGTALPGTACDDNNVLTENDVWDADCNCAGTLISSSITIADCPDNIIVTVANSGDLSVPVTWTAPTATTTCPTDGLSLILVPGTPGLGGDFPIGVTSVTYGGNDDCGNTAGCTFNVIVSDLLVDDCEGTPGGTALPGTACDDNNVLTENDVWDADCNCAGTLISSSITITDCPDNIIVTVANPGDLTVPVTWTTPTATTDCPTDGLSFVLIPGSPASGSDFSIGVTSITYGGNDDCGNTAGCTFNVIVSDFVAVDCAGTPGGTAVIDACGNCVEPTSPFYNFCKDCPTLGLDFNDTCDDGDALTENDVVQDDCSCAGTPISTSITIVDCPDNILVTVANAGDLTVPATWTAPTATTTCPTDGLGLILVPGSLAPGSDFPIGVTSVTYGASDACNNNAGCSFNVIVSDLLVDDCEGTPGGTALPGTACDDGDPLTQNDVWDTNCNCAGTQVTCSVSIDISNKICDDNGTPYDKSDDTYTFDVTVFRTGGASNEFTGSISNAYLGAAQFSGAYNTPMNFGPYPAGTFTSTNTNPPVTVLNGLDIDVSVTDSGPAACSDNVTVTSPGPCSNLVYDCVDLQANIGDSCDDGDALTENDEIQGDCSCSGTIIAPTDCPVTYEVIDNNIIVSGIPTTNAYYYTVKVLDNSFIPVDQCGTFLGMNCAPVFAVNDLPSGTYWIQIQVQDASDFTTYICQVLESVNIDNTPPPACVINAAASGIRCDDNGTADPSDDTFTYNLTISGGTAWGYFLNGVESYQPNFVSETVSMGPFAIADGIRTDVIYDYDNPSCGTQVSVTPPAPCSGTPPICSILASASNIQCDDNGTSTPDDDTYTYDLTISGGTGNGYTLNGTDVSDPGFVSATVSMGPFAISAGVRTDNVSDYQNASCSDVAVVSPPAPCSTPDPGSCQATYVVNPDGTITVSGLDGVVNIVKVHDVGDNFNTIWSCDPWYANTPTCGSTTTTDPLLPGVYYLKILTFSDAGITQTVCDISEYITITPPTGDCAISATISNIVCSDEGTPSPDDDTYSFDVNVNRVNGGTAGWEILGTSINNVSGSSATVNGNLISDGNRIYIVRDEQNTNCKTTIRVIPPAPCSTTGGCLGNVTSGGSIRLTEATVCSGEQPGPIMNQQLPSGGTGEIEYLWLASTTGCPNDISDAIPNTNVSSYQPGALTQTTYFRRCSRRKGCTDWTEGETTCVKIEVETCNPPTDCDISIDISGNDVTVSGLPDENQYFNSVKIFVKGTPFLVAQCHNWSSPTCGSSVTFDNLSIGDYTIEVLSQVDFTSAPKCSESMDFTVGSNTSRMITFDAEYAVGIVELNWTDLLTNEGDDYEIEKSNDGVNFEPLLNVISEEDSDAPKFFQRKDLNPLAGDNFYRLKLHTAEGEEFVSEIRKIRISDIENFGLFPNPATEEVNISFRRFEDRPTTIQLTNQLGQVVKVMETDGSGFSRQTLSLAGMPSGIYTVWVFPEGMKPVGKKLIIAKK